MSISELLATAEKMLDGGNARRYDRDRDYSGLALGHFYPDLPSMR